VHLYSIPVQRKRKRKRKRERPSVDTIVALLQSEMEAKSQRTILYWHELRAKENNQDE
jgi:hypothetical protein